MKFLWAFSASFLLCAVGVAQCPPTRPVLDGSIGVGTITPSILRAHSLVGLKDAPFSADSVSETDRILPDGKRRHREVHGKVFRDSEGRMRWETESLSDDGRRVPIIIIEDPVEGREIEIDENTKVACVSPHWRASDNQPTPRFPVYGNDSEEELGIMQMEGFTVTGTRQTRRFPAGTRGIDGPWVSTTEIWFSPELKMTLLFKAQEPLGRYIAKLVNPRAGEPDPSLFRIPAGYAIRDSTQQSK